MLWRDRQERIRPILTQSSRLHGLTPPVIFGLNLLTWSFPTSLLWKHLTTSFHHLDRVETEMWVRISLRAIIFQSIVLRRPNFTSVEVLRWCVVLWCLLCILMRALTWPFSIDSLSFELLQSFFIEVVRTFTDLTVQRRAPSLRLLDHFLL